jgi:hypothetical protein
MIVQTLRSQVNELKTFLSGYYTASILPDVANSKRQEIQSLKKCNMNLLALSDDILRGDLDDAQAAVCYFPSHLAPDALSSAKMVLAHVLDCALHGAPDRHLRVGNERVVIQGYDVFFLSDACRCLADAGVHQQ